MAVLAVEFVRLPHLGETRADIVGDHHHQANLEFTDQWIAWHVSRVGKRLAVQRFVPADHLPVSTGKKYQASWTLCVEGIAAAEAGTDARRTEIGIEALADPELNAALAIDSPGAEAGGDFRQRIDLKCAVRRRDR